MVEEPYATNSVPLPFSLNYWSSVNHRCGSQIETSCLVDPWGDPRQRRSAYRGVSHAWTSWACCLAAFVHSPTVFTALVVALAFRFNIRRYDS